MLKPRQGFVTKNLDSSFACSYLAALICALASPSAYATLTLKQVQAVEGNRIEIVFDGKIQKSQVRSEVLGDIVQVTLADTDVYPAKISNLSGHLVKKVFAYQYAPRTVRVRMTLRDPKFTQNTAADQLVQWNTSGKSLSLAFAGSAASLSDAVESGHAHPEAVSEERLAERISRTEASKSDSGPAANTSEKNTKNKSESGRIAGGKDAPGPLAAFGKLMAVLALFLIAAMAIRRLLTAQNGISGKLARRLGKFKSKGPIEVIATHYLGPKKSIAVVRIGGREMVLGITDEAINLITHVQQGISDEAELAHESQQAVQTDVLPLSQTPSSGAAFDAVLSQSAKTPQNASRKSSVRSQIRSRLEGMKQL